MNSLTMNSVILDLETGGFSPASNALCELAFIVINPFGEKLAESQSYIKPYYREKSDEFCSYKPDAMAVNGITMEQINSGQGVEVVLNNMLEYIREYEVITIIAHNGNGFDFKWLDYLLFRFASVEDMAKFNTLRKVDTVDLAKGQLNLASYKLQALAEKFEIPYENAHTALGDCEILLKVYNCLR